MQNILDLSRYPIDRPKSLAYQKLVARCQANLAEDGMYNLKEFLHPGIAQFAADALKSQIVENSFIMNIEHTNR